MNLIGIDASDSTYQAYRANTKLGLEVGSLVVGGYGAIKAGIGMSKLVKVAVQPTKVLTLARQLKWPSPSNGLSVINGIEYTTHALERVAPRGLIQKGTNIISRGVPPSVVDNAIKFGSKSIGNTPLELIHTFENVRVVTNLKLLK